MALTHMDLNWILPFLDVEVILLCCSKHFTYCGIIKFITNTFPGAVAKPRSFFGDGTGRVFLDSVTCSGSESRLIDCGHCTLGQHNCHQHSRDAGVICSGRHYW